MGSIKPSDFRSGTDGGWKAKLLTHRFAKKALGSGGEGLYLIVQRQDAGKDDVREDYHYAGSLDFFVPTADGKSYQKATEAVKGDALGNNKATRYLASYVEAGFPESVMGEDISVLDNLDVTMTRVADTPSGKAKERIDTTKDNRVLRVLKVHNPPTGAKTSQAEQKAVKAISGLLAENKGSVAIGQIATLVFAKLMSDPDRDAVLKFAADQNWLQSKFDLDKEGNLTLEQVPF